MFCFRLGFFNGIGSVLGKNGRKTLSDVSLDCIIIFGSIIYNCMICIPPVLGITLLVVHIIII